MNIEDLTIGEAREIAALVGYAPPQTSINNKMIGSYVIVRCRDAGVHAGILISYNGRECVLTDSRRLWYWKPANGAAFLSGVATQGLDDASKVGAPVEIHLTENCEIIKCTPEARKSISAAKSHDNN